MVRAVLDEGFGAGGFRAGGLGAGGFRARELGAGALDLKSFAQAGLVVTVWSSALQERVIFASDNAEIGSVGTDRAEIDGLARPGEDDFVVYRAAELERIWQLGGADLRKIHEVKRVFGAPLVSDPVRDVPQAAVA